jgi:hypothetical protein
MPADGLRLLRALAAGAPPGTGDRQDAAGGTERNGRIEAFLFEFFSFHLPGFRRLKSGEVFDRVATATAPKSR